MKRTSKARKSDARIRRTRYRLGQALIRLIQEKPLAQITLQEVLARAGVGRSTFYVHYRDKNDLLLTQFDEGLQMWSSLLSNNNEKSSRVAPVAELFAHVRSARKLHRALADSGRLNDFFDLARGYFARGIEQRLIDSGHVSRLPRFELRARATALAGAMVSLLQWWLDHGAKESPEKMDELFHRMVWTGLH